MVKCHCSGVFFETILQESIKKGCSYSESAENFNAGQTCTACKPDMKKYCESKSKSQLQLLGVL
jgi:bacterioferritin-associated ferredoxin